MRLLRSSHTLLLFLFCLFLGACSEEQEVSPSSGDLKITFDYFPNLSEASYALYTEQIWASDGTRTAPPLKSGKLGQTTSSAKANLVFNDLLPGNYVFVVGNTVVWSVQVVAGKENLYEK